ncbi:similar to transcription factor Cmr1 [Plenodomus lingam JN3]|uniref:Similar to transcription factor Cmr1 n=1 Tax=Leptosphaeria maculans (strain JN3 / isolate v23.1.3 / race Av1-4-5-6-7-8) TaxID=985895 RepID=E5A4A2_LEPMJ|nr:similar to transcription factor Cmr1 [Plenodomus lingam JN3]CBX98447.1 similar to transcription factor Cmr1 [Plenodomus lingam JN3]
MSFARRDLLQRHYTVHGRNQNNEEGLPVQGIIPKSAGRTPIACEHCAKTKTKCDKKFPCSRCEARNLTCTSRPTRRQSKSVQRLNNPPGNSRAPSDTGSSPDAQTKQDDTTPSNESQANSQPSPQKPSQQNDRTSSSSLEPHSRNASVVSQPALANIQARSVSTTQIAITGTPPLFDQTPTNPLAHAAPIMSPLSTPVQGMDGFVSSTPVSGYEEFAQTAHDQPRHESPQLFMSSWDAIPMATDYGAMRIDPSLLMSMNMDMTMGQTNEDILGMIPDMNDSQFYGPMQTPITTPDMDENMSDLQIGSSASMYFHLNRNPSIADTGLIPDLGAIVAARDGWTIFRCTPPIAPNTCPRTARLNVERLEFSLKNNEVWGNWPFVAWDESDFQYNGQIKIAPLQEATRDKLLAITQSFLYKAFDIHKDGSSSSNSGESPGSTGSHSTFILLPPARVLEFFLKSYANSFEQFYPTSAHGVLDANGLMQHNNDKASSLLILMMIASGAMTIPSIEARLLTGGFIETCRISLFDLIEKNIIMASDPIVLRAALIFTVQAAWSGDKWQMDIAMGQRGMYCSMLRHAGLLAQWPTPLQPGNEHRGAEALWREWIEQESRSRLVYAWVMADQEISLFQDSAPIFSVTELGVSMPDTDQLWQAQTAKEWSGIFDEVHKFSNGISSVGSGVRPQNLRDLFRCFLDDEIVVHDVQEIHLTPMHLRLLLHPLQTLVCQFCQLLSCFSDSFAASRSRNRALSAASTRVRLEEVQALLGRWSDLAQRYLAANIMCPIMHANLVMFHLISLNAVTNFPQIERVARREDPEFDFQKPAISGIRNKCLSDAHEAISHAGQILRLVREMPRGTRSPWWAGAIYRAALVMWVTTFANDSPATPIQQNPHSSQTSSVPVDQFPPEHPTIRRYVSRGEGYPILTKRDGRHVLLDNGFRVLAHCIELIDEGVATRFSDGIRSKLDTLARS